MTNSSSANQSHGWKYVLMGKGQGKPLGPVSNQVILDLIDRGTVFPETRVLHDKYTKGKWVKAEDVIGLKKRMDEGPSETKAQTTSEDVGACPHCKHPFDRSYLGKKWNHEYLDKLEKKKRHRVVCCRGCQKWFRFSWKRNQLEVVSPPASPSSGETLSIFASIVGMPILTACIVGLLCGASLASLEFMYAMRTSERTFSHASGNVRYYRYTKITPDVPKAKKNFVETFWFLGSICAGLGLLGGIGVSSQKFTGFIEPLGGIYGFRQLTSQRE